MIAIIYHVFIVGIVLASAAIVAREIYLDAIEDTLG
jgi:hypothetical protein